MQPIYSLQRMETIDTTFAQNAYDRQLELCSTIFKPRCMTVIEELLKRWGRRKATHLWNAHETIRYQLIRIIFKCI